MPKKKCPSCGERFEKPWTDQVLDYLGMETDEPKGVECQVCGKRVCGKCITRQILKGALIRGCRRAGPGRSGVPGAASHAWR